MKQVSWLHLMSYVLVAILAVGSAFFVSLRFAARAHAQQPPSPQAPAAPAPSDPTAPPAPPADQAPAPQAPTTGVAPGTAAPGAQPGKQEEESAAAVAAEVQGFLEPFIYDSKNRRDPFEPYAEYQPMELAGGGSPLQKYDLDEYRLVGIMWDIHDPKAMFVDPERQVHMASRNESIGKRNGYIAVIREGEVVVVESLRKGRDVVSKAKVLRMER